MNQPPWLGYVRMEMYLKSTLYCGGCLVSDLRTKSGIAASCPASDAPRQKVCLREWTTFARRWQMWGVCPWLLTFFPACHMPLQGPPRFVWYPERSPLRAEPRDLHLPLHLPRPRFCLFFDRAGCQEPLFERE
jgi:hypothetical protein